LPDNKPKRRPSPSHQSEESTVEECMPNSGNLQTNTVKLSIRLLSPTHTTQRFVRLLLDNKLRRRLLLSHPSEESTVEECTENGRKCNENENRRFAGDYLI